MKQVFDVVLHQEGGAFQVAVRQRDSLYYATWSCRTCGAAGLSSSEFPDADRAFESVKKLISSHSCEKPV
jgi:hypothetical protein